ncbi:MAG: energy-coupling factor transporter transmembrane component T [Desulfobacterales bacterium]|nr:energy-coupling factor transporter transmembrane component T [Desulfobacterales bacterium]
MFDPRTHLALALIYGLLVIFIRDTIWLLGAWGILLILIGLTGQGPAYTRWLLMLLPMALFFGGITWWSVDRAAGLQAALSLLTLTSTFFVFFALTTPEDLGSALVKMGLPYDVAFVMTASLQFVPVITRKARHIMDAQRARGIELRPGWRALRNYPAFLGPLLIQAFQMADALAEAMECRGFGRGGRRRLDGYRMRPWDWGAIALGLVLGGGVLALRYTR